MNKPKRSKIEVRAAELSDAEALTRIIPPMTSMALGQSTTITLGVTGRRVDSRPFSGTGTLTLFR